GGLLAQPVADTVKRQTAINAGGSSSVVCAGSIDRNGLWLAQTPQMFQAGPLLQALQSAQGSEKVTDEASAMELAGHNPCLVLGSVRNFKVTWPEDFELMERWL